MLAGLLAEVRSDKAQRRPYVALMEIRPCEVEGNLAACVAISERANAAMALGAPSTETKLSWLPKGISYRWGGLHGGHPGPLSTRNTLQGGVGHGSRCLKKMGG